jgi:hypothetical protein
MEKTPHNSDSLKPTQSEESVQTEKAEVCGINFLNQRAESAEKLHSDGNGQGAAPASGSNGSRTGESSSDDSAKYVMLDPDVIKIDRSIWTRVQEDFFTVSIYFEALALNQVFDPIVVEEIDGQWTVLDGVHRLYSHRRMKESIAQADYKIPCRVATNPSKMSRLIYSYSLNRVNGKALEIRDYEKVAQALYKENLGAPITDLAAKLNMNWKTFKKYVARLKEEFEREREQTARHLKEMGFSDKSIEKQLLEKYPNSTGSSRSSVNRRSVKARKSAAENARRSTSAGSESPAGENGPTSPFWTSMGIDFSKEDEASKRDELHVIPGAAVLMERRVNFLRDDLRAKYVRTIVRLTEAMRKKELHLRANDILAGNKGDRGPPKRKKGILDMYPLVPRDGPDSGPPQARCRNLVIHHETNFSHVKTEKDRSSVEMVWREVLVGPHN